MSYVKAQIIAVGSAEKANAGDVSTAHAKTVSAFFTRLAESVMLFKANNFNFNIDNIYGGIKNGSMEEF